MARELAARTEAPALRSARSASFLARASSQPNAIRRIQSAGAKTVGEDGGTLIQMCSRRTSLYASTPMNTSTLDRSLPSGIQSSAVVFHSSTWQDEHSDRDMWKTHTAGPDCR